MGGFIRGERLFEESACSRRALVRGERFFEGAFIIDTCCSLVELLFSIISKELSNFKYQSTSRSPSRSPVSIFFLQIQMSVLEFFCIFTVTANLFLWTWLLLGELCIIKERQSVGP